MQSLIEYNKGIKYSLCVIDLFSKYAWVVPIKDKKKELVLFMHFKKLYVIQQSCTQIENQTKYGLIKVVNVVIIIF